MWCFACGGSLDLGFGAQAFLETTQFLLLQLLGDLGFDFLQLGQLGFTHIVHADDVVAELALDGGVGHLAFVQLDHGARELGHVAVGRSPVQVAAVGARAGVFGVTILNTCKYVVSPHT